MPPVGEAMKGSFSRQISERALARIGTTIQQKYQIDRLLGIGGMAAVYAATHRNGHRVAIKFLLERLSDDPTIQHLFSREAYVANQVGHPGAVPVLDDDVDDEGCPFLIMPLLEGQTLRERWEQANRHLLIAEVAVLMSDALDVLASAHANGIVHRDIKPDNLFVTTEGHVRVLDFGIARRIDGDGSVTATGRMIGTPAFMPPEQALGERNAVGPHSDCWAVGATIFSLLSGEFVHQTDSAGAQLAAAATRHARSLATAAPNVPACVVQFVDKALAFDGAARWPSAREMRVALVAAFEEALGGSLAPIATRVRADLSLELSPRSEALQATIRKDRKLEGAPAEGASEPTPPIALAGQGAPRSGKSEVVTTTMAAEAQAPGVGRRRRSRSGFFAAIATLVLGAIVFSVVYRPVASKHVEVQSSTSEVGASEPSSTNSEAVAHLNAGIQAWRDASLPAAEQSFARALELDSGLAAAHLYSSMLTTWTNDQARGHHHAASAHRKRLHARDQMLLDAYAPAMAMPPDLVASEQRLTAARAKFPSDWVVLHSLANTQITRGEVAKAMAVVDELLRHDVSLAIAWQDKGFVFALLDDVINARNSLQECLRLSPYGTTCLERLASLDLNEGHCVDAEEHVRTLMALPAPTDLWAYGLAEAIQGRGGAPESVRDILERTWQLAPHARREIVRLQNETHFNVLGGAFIEAQTKLDAWGEAVASIKYESEHARFARTQFYMALELGQRSVAGRLASEYLAKREAWLAPSFNDWEILPLRVQYLAGRLSLEGFEKRRQAWLARQAARPQLLDARNLGWTYAYALAVATPADAREALRVLPQYLPITDRLTRDVESDNGIGRVYLLAGEVEKALPYLRRGASSCRAIRSPFDHTWAQLHLGMALEQMGDLNCACKAYDVVLNRWGKDRRSVSAKTARTRHAALRCLDTAQ